MLKGLLGVGADSQMYNRLYEDDALWADPVDYYEREVAKKDFINTRYVRYLNGDLRQCAIAHQLYQNFLADQLSGHSPEDLAAGIQRLAETIVTDYVESMLAQNPT